MNTSFSDFRDNLNMMLNDMELAPEDYRPTNFWSSGLPAIMKDIDSHGIETFRTHPSAAFFYVPLYASRTWQRWQNGIRPLASRLPPRKRRRLMSRLTRSDRARLDYRLFCATSNNDGLDLGQVSESTVGGGERFEFDGRLYSRSMLNYLRALNFYKRTVNGANPESCLEIGGGYGSLGEILLKASPSSFYVNADIPPVAAVSTWYLQQVFGPHLILSYASSREMDVIDLDRLRKRYKAVVLCPWQLPRLRGSVDLFANFFSFQEMEPHVVRNYASVVQPYIRDHILMRNSAVGKRVAKTEGEIGVMEQVRSDFIQSCFSEFQTLASDSFLFGDENEIGSYRSEVVVMGRRDV